MTRAERVAAVLAEYREDMFRSEYRPEGRHEYVVRSDIAQTVWQDMTRAVLAAQEGERGGAEVATGELPCGCVDRDEEGPVRLCLGHRWLIDPAGALAKHDAEVLRAAADRIESWMFPSDARRFMRAEADRIEAQP